MSDAVFKTKFYRYEVDNWQKAKHDLSALINQDIFEDINTFLSDRIPSNNAYLKEFVSIIESQLKLFKNELGVQQLIITKVWTVKYLKGHFHPPHVHSSNGYSGVLYLEYNAQEHTGTYFIDPTIDIVTDRTNFCIPEVTEGQIIIAPSNILHFTYPNTSDHTRMIIGFDIKLPGSYWNTLSL